MNPIFALFLLQGETTPPPSPPQVAVVAHEWPVLLGAAGLVLLLIVVWFLVTLRPNRRSRHHRSQRPEPDIKTATQAGKRRHRRRHRYQSDDLPRNPTLAETGGLPPIRNDRVRQGQSP
jgi:hypothetical protein